MRIWTIQPVCVWEQIQQEGRSLALPRWDYAPHDPYRWLAAQCHQRLPVFPGELPWWAYLTKPDLRWVRHRREAGIAFVRIELEPAPESFLVYPCWAWARVFLGQYLALNGTENEEWERRIEREFPDEDTRPWPLPDPFRAELEVSWQRLFSPTLPAASPLTLGEWEPDFGTSREAVLGALNYAEVRDVTHFQGSYKTTVR